MTPSNGQNRYGDYRILTASPAGLVKLLYNKAISQVEAAGECLRNKDPEGRARNVNGAVAVLSELLMSLNHEVAPELSSRLKALYDYMQWRLVTGHSTRDESAFGEVLQLLRSLGEAWEARTELLQPTAPVAAAAARPQATSPNPYGTTQAVQAAPRRYL